MPPQLVFSVQTLPGSGQSIGSVRTVDVGGSINSLSFTGSDAVFADRGGFSSSSGTGLLDVVGNPSTGDLYFVDWGQDALWKAAYSPTLSRVVSHICGIVGGGIGGPDYELDTGLTPAGLAASSNPTAPTAIAIDPDGNIFFTAWDWGVCCVNMQPTTQTILGISIPAGYAAIVAGLFENKSYSATNSQSGDGGPATSSPMDPYFRGGIAINPVTRDLYLIDSGVLIRKVDHATGIIKTIYGLPTTGIAGGDGGLAAQASGYATTIKLDAQGNILLTYAGYPASTIRAINTTGSTQVIFGKSIPAGCVDTFAGYVTNVTTGAGPVSHSGDGGAATSATFDVIRALALTRRLEIFM